MPALRRVKSGLKKAVVWAAASTLRAMDVRFVALNVHRIGHLAAEYDCHLKAEQLGLVPKHRRIICPPAAQDFANATLLDYWRPFAPVITSKRVRKLIEPVTRHPYVHVDTDDYVMTIDGTAFYLNQVLPRWGDQPPLLRLSDEHRSRGERGLRDLGVEPGRWYVCIHARTETFAQGEDQSYRNCDAATFDAAIDAIVERGGIAIRMGDPSMPKMAPRRGLIDYVHTPLRSDFLDVFLSASCRFFVGSCSGLSCVPVIFGVPIVSVNICPTSHVLAYTHRDLTLPKLIRSNATGRPMTFPELFAGPIADLRFGAQFREAGVTVIDNTREEIFQVVMEMLERVEGTHRDSPDDEALQQRFRSLFHEGNYTFGGPGRVGADFLRAHRKLLD